MNTNKREVYEVQGMTCGGCERSVQKIVSAIPGVLSAEASVANGSIKVDYDEARVTLNDIRNAVEKLGYKVGNKKS